MKVPLVVGVTGHRGRYDLPESGPNGVVTAVRQSLEFWLAEVGPDTPIVILTACADGADIDIATVAIKLRDEGENIRVVGVLPMPADLYESDFPEDSDSGSTTRAEFRELIKRLDTSIVLSKQMDEESNDANKRRQQSYLACGLTIARHSNVMLALWDGAGARGLGGTAEIAQFVLGQGVAGSPASSVQRIPFLDGQESTMLWHIPVVREGGGAACSPVALAADLGKPLPQGSSAYFVGAESPDMLPSLRSIHDDQQLAFNQLIQEIRQINRDINSLTGNPDGFTLYGESLAEELREIWNDSVSRHVNGLVDPLQVFWATDQLAIKQQKLHNRTIFAYCSLVAVIVGAFQWYSHDGSSLAMVAMFASVFLLAVVLWVMRALHIHDRFQRARAVAECLRVGIVVFLNGYRNIVDRLISRRERIRTPIAEHILMLCDLVFLDSVVVEKITRHSPNVGENVMLAWSQSQYDYFTARRSREIESPFFRNFGQRRPLATSIWLVSLSMRLVMMAVAVVIVSGVTTVAIGVSIFHGISVLIVGLLLALSGMAALWDKLWGFREIDFAYGEMLRLFNRFIALKKLASRSASSETRKADIAVTAELDYCFLALAAEAISENLAWTRVHGEIEARSGVVSSLIPGRRARQNE